MTIKDRPIEELEQIYINCPETLEPGEIVVGVVLKTGGPNQTVAIQCIRPATLPEYLAFIEEKGLGHMVNRSIHNMNLYLVEVLD